LLIAVCFGFAETEKGIFDAILQGDIDFESSPWPSISDGAKDLIRKMLTQDPRKRITAAQVLGLYLYFHKIYDAKINNRLLNVV